MAEAEAEAALRVEDVDFTTGVISPSIQCLDEPLKSDMSRTPIPIPREMADLLAEAIRLGDGRFLAPDQWGNRAGPWGDRTRRPRVPRGGWSARELPFP